jgi:hypothetical protein
MQPEHLMHSPHGLLASRAPWSRLFASLTALLLLALPLGIAQDPEPEYLVLDRVVPGGVRTSATESWGRYDFELTNRSDTDRRARVLAFFGNQPDVQYGRDVWVPAQSTLSTWILVGPAVEQSTTTTREIQMLLYDRTDGKDRLVLPRGGERIRSRGVLYKKREPFTAILRDEKVPQGLVFGQLPQPDSKADEALAFVRTFRFARKLSEFVQLVHSDSLPATAEAFDGVDHLVLASGRTASDPAGMRALRHWLQRGGRLWVMLDLVEPEALAPLLGDSLDFQVVDRVSLTKFKIETTAGPVVSAQGPGGKPNAEGLAPRQETSVQEHERPVDFVRVLLPLQERPRHTVNGWPAWFTRPVGRGKVVFTTLGPRGWFRPRARTDPRSPHESFPSPLIPTEPMEAMAAEVQPPREEDPFRVEAFQAPLTEEIGYSIVSRAWVGLIFGAFLITALVLGITVRRSRRPEWWGWLVPAVALAATAALLMLGEASRRSAAPTVAVAQIVDADSGTEEAALHGLLLIYRPDSGPAEIGAGQGGLFDLDMTGIAGQTRRLILTDRDSWHWENLSLPAGVRSARFRYTASIEELMTAVAHFGPEGIEGKLTAGPFRGLGDALLSTPSGRHLSIRLGDRTGSVGGEHGRPATQVWDFRATDNDILPQGQFVANRALLSDKQQRRQELYREFLKQPGTVRVAGRNFLLAWADPIDMGFTLAPEAQLTGTALLIVPLRLERSPPGSTVTIPGPLIPCQRVIDRGLIRLPRESSMGIDMHLRFQLPASVLPFKVVRAGLNAKINAPSRRVTIAGWADHKLVEVHHLESPLDPIHLDISQDLLRLDGDGGLHLNVAFSEVLGGSKKRLADEKWTIEYLELQVAGLSEE